jgi:hypothetical protein
MKRLFILMLAVLCAGIVSVMGQTQKKVAVYVTGGQDAGINKVLGDQLVSAFANSGKYIAIERTSSFLAELGKEQNYQRTGAVDDNELSRLGKQFGVQLVCVAEINDAFGEKYVSARLIDVESAEVVSAANKSSQLKSMSELLDVTQTLTKELTGPTVKERAAEQARVTAENEVARQSREEKEKAKRDARAAGYYLIDNIAVLLSYTSNVVWYDASKLANDVTTDGHRDWRLPTTGELTRIFNSRETIWGSYRNSPFWYVGSRVWTANKCGNRYETVETISGGSTSTIDCHGGKATVVLVRTIK